MVDYSVSGSELLDDLHAALTKYVILPTDEAADAIVLWIAATHGLSAFEHATRLAVHSPVKRCGKSRLLEVIQATAYSTVSTTNISVPALFRMIDAAEQPPTLVLDEADRLFGSAKKDEENRDLIAVLNNGFRQGNPTWRCVGPQQVPTPFSNYAMAAIAGIGRKPDTIEDRAINVTMRRRMPGETVAKFRLRTDVPALHDLRERLNAWVTSKLDDLEAPIVDIPDKLEDRAEDAWEPIIAVADAAGGSWPQRARLAAVKITHQSAGEDTEQSDEMLLLSDIRDTFAAAGAGFMATTTLLEHLHGLEESPSSEERNGKFTLTARKLATRLCKFGAKPLLNTTRTARGYYLDDLLDPFGRYLPSKPSDPPETPADLHKRVDGSKPLDGSTRPVETTRPDKPPGQTANGRVRTGWTDAPDASAIPGPCRVCRKRLADKLAAKGYDAHPSCTQEVV